MPAKLYVGNLAFSVTNEDLEALFGQMGKVDNVAVVTDKFSGQSRGFGFVQMADANEAARAISELNGTELKGRAIRVSEARDQGPRTGGGGGAGDRNRGGARGGRSGGRGEGSGGNRRW